jgi:hypothetical protein
MAGGRSASLLAIALLATLSAGMMHPAFAVSLATSPRIGNPFQKGTMTLVDSNQPRFDFTGGHIRFTRYLGPKVSPGACS